MAMNALTVNQIAPILNDIYKQATGQEAMSTINANEFVAVAGKTLLSDYDVTLEAISQVLSRTIFSTRPYYRKFSGLQVSNQVYGNHTRKLQTFDGEAENDGRYVLQDGQSVDMYTVNLPKVVQTNFYGETVWEVSKTFMRDQLNIAFSSAEEFAQFVSMVMQDVTNMIEQMHETTARNTVCNLIQGNIAIGGANIIHLVTEYNAVAGTELTATTVYQPENFVPFMKWAYARIQTLCSLLTERTTLYHQNFTDQPILRHTPYQRMKAYLYSPTENVVATSVLGDMFNDKYMNLIDHERVNFWQSINTPASISSQPVYIDVNGVITSGSKTTTNNVFGIIFDDEAAGYTVVNQWADTTPFNAKGGYANTYWHFTDKYWNDFTENAIVLLMD